MIAIHGEVVEVAEVSKDGKKPYTRVRVYSNGVGRPQVMEVRDQERRNWAKGESVVISVNPSNFLGDKGELVELWYATKEQPGKAEPVAAKAGRI